MLMRRVVAELPSQNGAGLIRGLNDAGYRYGQAHYRTAEPSIRQGIIFDLRDGKAGAAYPIFEPKWPSRKWLAPYFSPYGRVGQKDYWLYGVLSLVVTGCIFGWVLDAARLAIP
jgi:hypothetical protein